MNDAVNRRFKVTGSESYENKLENLVAGLERLSVDAGVKAPAHQQELRRLLGEARSVVAEARLKPVERPARPRRRATVTPEILAEGEWLKDQLAGPPTDAEAPHYLKVVVLGVRVEGSTDRMAWLGIHQGVAAEGRWLKATLSGPPADDSTPRLFRDILLRVGLEASTDWVAEARADDAVLD
jgi:hypothetical protein